MKNGKFMNIPAVYLLIVLGVGLATSVSSTNAQPDIIGRLMGVGLATGALSTNAQKDDKGLTVGSAFSNSLLSAISVKQELSTWASAISVQQDTKGLTGGTAFFTGALSTNAQPDIIGRLMGVGLATGASSTNAQKDAKALTGGTAFSTSLLSAISVKQELSTSVSATNAQPDIIGRLMGVGLATGASSTNAQKDAKALTGGTAFSTSVSFTNAQQDTSAAFSTGALSTNAQQELSPSVSATNVQQELATSASAINAPQDIKTPTADASTQLLMTSEGDNPLDDKAQDTIRSIYISCSKDANIESCMESALLSKGLFENLEVNGPANGILDVRYKLWPIIKQVQFSKGSPFSFKKRQFGLSEDSIFDPVLLSDAVQDMGRELVGQGRYFSKIDHDLTPLEDGYSSLSINFSDTDRIKIRKIIFKGNDSIASEALKAGMMAREMCFVPHFLMSVACTPAVAEYDKDVIKKTYADSGYPDAFVSEVKIEKIWDNAWADVIFNIEEGEFFEINSVSIDCPNIDSCSKELEKDLLTKKGKPYDASSMAADTDYIARKLRASTKKDVAVQVVPSPVGAGKLDIVFKPVVRAPVYIRAIDIKGNSYTLDSTIRHMLRIHEGDPFSQKDLEGAYRRLKSSEFFDKLDLNIIPGGEYVDIEVLVTDKRTTQVGATASMGANEFSQMNARQSYLKNLQGSLNFADSNWRGTGQQRSLSAMCSPRHWGIIGSLGNNNMFNNDIYGGVDFSYLEYSISHVDQRYAFSKRPQSNSGSWIGGSTSIFSNLFRSTEPKSEESIGKTMGEKISQVLTSSIASGGINTDTGPQGAMGTINTDMHSQAAMGTRSQGVMETSTLENVSALNGSNDSSKSLLGSALKKADPEGLAHYKVLSLSPRVTFDLGPDLSLGLSLGCKWQKVDNFNKNLSRYIRDIEGVHVISWASSKIAYDTRDVPSDPTKGLLWMGGLEGFGLLTKYRLAKIESSLEAYFPLGYLDTILQSRLSGGWLKRPKSSSFVNVYDRFFVGEDIVRGFLPRSTGPVDTKTGDFLGADYFMSWKIQTEIPLVESKKLRFSLFSDFAYVGGKRGLGIGNDDVDENVGIRASLGFGFLFASPFGAVRMDFGFPLKSNNADLKADRFIPRFSVGKTW